jgi:hypothetical protein
LFAGNTNNKMKQPRISLFRGYLKPITIGTLFLVSITVFLVECSGGGGGGQPGVPVGQESVHEPFQELVQQGVTKYLGIYTPMLVTLEGGVGTYSFGGGEGPLCFDGSEYVMSVRDTGSENLLIFLQGGGACWSDICRCTEFSSSGIPCSGILDPNAPQNPVKSWSTAFLTSCDGSHYAGDTDLDVDGDGVIDRYHRGLKNLSAGLDVTADAFPKPRKILLAGTSAGGFGAAYALPLVRSIYPDAFIYLLNDSGVGIMPPGMIAKMLSDWNATRFIPQSCPDCLRKDGFLSNYYSWQLSEDSKLKIALMSYKRDTVIADQYSSMGGESFEKHLLAEIASIEQAYPGRVHSFIVDGSLHGLLGHLQVTAGTSTVGEWITQMLEDSPNWTSVSD